MHFINALNGPIVTNGFLEQCEQDLHVIGMNQSNKGMVSCVHGDVYTASR